MWPQIATAGLSALGGAIGGGGGTDKVRPIHAVPEYVRDQYKDVTTDFYDDLSGLPNRRHYSGPMTAGINAPLDASLRHMQQYGQKFGGKVKKNQYGAGLEGRKAMDKGLSFTSQLAQQGPNQFGYDQGTFNNIFGNLMPGMQGAYDAATRDNNRNLNWNTLPGLQMQGVGAGAQGSTKLGQAGALAAGMTADRNADIGSALWMNAANQANQGAMQGGTLNLQSANMFNDDVLQGYQQFANLGLPQLQNSYNTGMSNIGLQNQAGQFRQQHRQNEINAKMAKNAYNRDAPYNDLQARANMINAGLPGGQIIPGQPGMTPWEGATQGAYAGLGLYNAYQNSQTPPYVPYAQPASVTPHNAPQSLDPSAHGR